MRKVLFTLLPALLAAPAAAQRTVLLEDGGFAQWATRSSFEDRAASGRVDAAAGAPPPSYRVDHEHRPGGPFAAEALSRSVYGGATYDVSGYAPGDRLELAVDLCLEGLGGVTPPPVTLSMQPVLLQGTTLLRPVGFGSSQPPAPGTSCSRASPAFTRQRVIARLRDFVGVAGQALDLSPGAPRVQLGMLLQTTWPASATALIRADNLVVTHVAAGTAGDPVLDLTDFDGGWDSTGALPIAYRVVLENPGPARDGARLELEVPARTCLVTTTVHGEWQCGGGPCSIGRTARCSLPLGRLASGESRNLDLEVTLQAGVPADWEFFAEALLFAGGAELTSDSEVTPPVGALSGPGCFCLFLPALCGA